MADGLPRVLIVGRSRSVLLDAVELLRERGYAANASNQFDQLLDDYDLREVDLVMFGGMVPPETKARLQKAIRVLNARAAFLEGLGGIASLLAAQVEQYRGGGVTDVEFDEAARAVRVRLTTPASVVVEGLWATFVPPEPVAHSAVAFDGELGAGTHEITVPDEVPREASYAVVRVGSRVSAFQIGSTPESVRQLAASRSLPAPEPVTTRLPYPAG